MVVEELENIAQSAPEIIEMFSIGTSYLGKELNCFKITNESITRQKAKALVVAHHHGREQITIELALRFILDLVNGFGSDSQITKYLNTLEVFVIPTLNPDALDRVVNEQDYWLRKNLHPYDNDYDGESDEDPIDDANGDGWISRYDVHEKIGEATQFLYSYYEGIDDDGDGEFNEDEIGYVDLNRNYDAGWGGGGSSGDPTDQTFRGRSPFSEPETQAMRDFAEQHRFAMAFSLHSGINATYLPTDENGYVEPELYDAVIEDFVDILPSGFLSRRLYSVENDERPIIEANHFGKWSDWMYLERNTPVPVCFEVFHDGDVDDSSRYSIYLENSTHVIEEWHDIYGFFNPPASKIHLLWIQLRAAFIYLLDMIPLLVFDVEVLPNTSTANNDVRLGLDITCRAERIGTVEPVVIKTPDDVIVQTLEIIEPNAKYMENLTISLPHDATTGPTEILIGNNYTGFYPVSIERSLLTTVTIPTTDTSNTMSESTTPPSPFFLDGVQIVVISSVVIVIIVGVIIMKRR